MSSVADVRLPEADGTAASQRVVAGVVPSKAADPGVSPRARDAYRPEIDGLRAVAVSSVVLYHWNVPGFRGGFVGVDVFFVISGYLISRLVLGQLEQGRFTFSEFYGRRARRLFPALFVTLAATFGFSVAILTSSHLVELAQSVVEALLSLSNVFFWSKAGYWDTASELKPLLHTWSLGVEEQFYLIWPVALAVVFRRWGRSGSFALVTAVGLTSLAAAEYVTGVAPSAAFFLTPFRMWELSLGAACLWIEPRLRGSRWQSEGFTLLGLGLVAASVFSYSSGMRFPGVSAVVPCVGAALVLASPRADFSGLLLSNPLMTWVGRVSYSLYLVHWPVMTLYRYHHGGAMRAGVVATMIGASVALAAVMYAVVEQRFRHPKAKALSPAAFGLSCAIASLLLVLPVAHALAGRGWPEREAKPLQEAAMQLPMLQAAQFDDIKVTEARPFPAPGRRNGVIVGDSHAANVLTALLEGESTVNYRMFNIPYECQPTFGSRAYGEGTPLKTRELAENCRLLGEQLKNNEMLRAADLILVSSAWSEAGIAGVGEVLAYFKASYRAKIVVLGPRHFFLDPGKLLGEVNGIDEANRRFDAAKSDYGAALDALSATAQRVGVEFIDLGPFTCGDERGVDFCPLFDERGKILYWDFHHWTRDGARRVAQRLKGDARFAYLFSGPGGPAPGGPTDLVDAITDVAPAGMDESRSVNCDASIDLLNGAPPVPSGTLAARMLRVEGWSAISAKEGIGPRRVLIRLQGVAEARFVELQHRVARNDVKLAYNHPSMPDVGFMSTFDISGLRGRYKLGLVRENGGTFEICGNVNFLVVVQ